MDKYPVNLADLSIFLADNSNTLNISFAQKNLIKRLAQITNHHPELRVNQTLLAKYLNITTRHLRRIIKPLIALNLIIVEKIWKDSMYKVNVKLTKDARIDSKTEKGIDLNSINLKNTTLEITQNITGHHRTSPDITGHFDSKYPVDKSCLSPDILTEKNDDSLLYNYNNIYYINKIIPRLELRGEKNMDTESLADGFDEFWRCYPRKAAHAKCLELWKKNELHKKTKRICYDVLMRTQHHESWLRGYIHNPLNYLTNEMWEDDIIKKTVEEKRSGQNRKYTFAGRLQEKIYREASREIEKEQKVLSRSLEELCVPELAAPFVYDDE